MRAIKFTPSRTGLIDLIEETIRQGGSDLHLKAPGRPHIRVGDRLVPTPHDRVTAQEMRQLMAVLLEMSGEEPHLAATQDTRFSMGIEGLGRFRVQAGRQRGSWGVVIHVIATEAPTLSALGLDAAGATVVGRKSGLVLVGGGRRRQTAIGALVHEYNRCVPGHIVSIEEPMDYLHRDHRASVTQREVGEDVADFYGGVVAALRQDPDALAVSDIPDVATAEAVLRATEEGLLVFAGIAALDGSQAVRAFLRRFPSAQEPEMHTRLLEVLRGVISVPNVGEAGFEALDDGAEEAIEAQCVA